MYTAVLIFLAMIPGAVMAIAIAPEFRRAGREAWRSAQLFSVAVPYIVLGLWIGASMLVKATLPATIGDGTMLTLQGFGSVLAGGLIASAGYALLARSPVVWWIGVTTTLCMAPVCLIGLVDRNGPTAFFVWPPTCLAWSVVFGWRFTRWAHGEWARGWRVCPHCGYNVASLPRPITRCPECGAVGRSAQAPPHHS